MGYGLNDLENALENQDIVSANFIVDEICKTGNKELIKVAKEKLIYFYDYADMYKQKKPVTSHR